MRHLTLVTNGFFATSCLLGVPSLIGFLYFGSNALRLWLMKPPPIHAPQSSDTLIRGLEWGAYAFAKAFSVLGAFGQWVVTLLTLAAAAVLVFSVALFFTARGLQAHHEWARVAAICLSVLVLLPSLLAALSAGRSGINAWVPFAASVYAIGVLWRHWN
jgi:hypothetical protein